MSSMVKSATLICGSPKPRSNRVLSEYFIDLETKYISCEDIAVSRINARISLQNDDCEADFKTMLASDALIFTFPLYFFCLPGLLMRFLQDYAAYSAHNVDKNKPKKVYAVINCGFPEAELNAEAARVIRSFCNAIGAEYRFSLLIGSGGMILGLKEASFMRSSMDFIDTSFKQVRDDILSDSSTPQQDVSIEMRVSRKLYFLMGNIGWRRIAKKEHHLRARYLKKRPYRD